MGRALALRDQKLGVRERFLTFYSLLYAYECCMAKLICVRF